MQMKNCLLRVVVMMIADQIVRIKRARVTTPTHITTNAVPPNFQIIT